jgi:hypothetical protein
MNDSMGFEISYLRAFVLHSVFMVPFALCPLLSFGFYMCRGRKCCGVGGGEARTAHFLIHVYGHG